MNPKYLIILALLSPGSGMSSQDFGKKSNDLPRAEESEERGEATENNLCTVTFSSKRCNFRGCRKKLRLATTFACRLCSTEPGPGVLYCTRHRYHDDHEYGPENAGFKKHQEQLKKHLPKIVADKIERF